MSSPEGGYAPQQGVGQPGYGQYQQGGADSQGGAGQAMASIGRHVRTPETKEFFKTSEFLIWALTVAGVLLAGLLIGDHGQGTQDNFRAPTVWTLVTLLSVAYIISRGIAKAGTKRGYGDAPGDRA